MIRELFNEGWDFCPEELTILDFKGTGAGGMERGITLPHDAMIHEKRTPDTSNGNATGFYPGNSYTYLKRFDVPVCWQEKDVFLEFEGVYMYASVYVNGNFAAKRPYGYAGFSLLLNDYLVYGQQNALVVVAKTGHERTGRWYTGAGIYRDVYLTVCDPLHIPLDGVRIHTAETDKESACVMVDVDVENNHRLERKITVVTEIVDPRGMVVQRAQSPLTAWGRSQNKLRHRIFLNHPKLWSCEQPDLYQCIVRLMEDREKIDRSVEHFGIRSLALDVENGLRINGQPVKLRGACIHHDNGLIGACTLPAAEERRCRQLKQAGFNCIRSAHNPMSRAMLEACDRLGMLVIDEAYDGWNKAKIDHDSSLYFDEWWQKDLAAMVRKDYHHPSVVIYSLGNEIKEAGTPQGAAQHRSMVNWMRCLDDTRYFTASISGLFILIDRLPDILAEKDAATEPFIDGDAAAASYIDEETSHRTGSDDINSLLARLHNGMGDLLFNHPLLKERTEEFFAAADIAGMNYMTECFEKDHKRYPDRIILSAESFPADIAHVWDVVERNPYIIGDMTWAGYDYLGEAGCGIYHYDGRQNFSSNWPDRLGYIGDINLIGDRRPISYLREIVYGLRREPYIAVERLDKYGLPVSTTPWMGKDDIASWSWPGYEGKPAIINVFSPSEEVELWCSGELVGRKPAGRRNGFTACFEISYRPGSLTAVGFTAGREEGRMSLYSAQMIKRLTAKADRDCLKADGRDLCFVKADVCDTRGILHILSIVEISVQVKGAGTLQGFGSADPQSIGCYDDTCCSTFDGSVMAVVRAKNKPGTINLTFTAKGMEPCTVRIDCE